MSIYKDLSRERKRLQDYDHLPPWVTTNSYQMLKEKYLYEGETLRDRYTSIAMKASSYMPFDKFEWARRFFNILWNGWLAASTPVLANMGREKGCPVSCSGGYIGDSIYDFYNSQVEAAVLSKNGFGISGYLGDIRPRGSSITGMKGSASGVLPVFKDFTQLSRDVSQSGTRRGAWAGYVSIDSEDFDELINFISANPDDANIGWIISDDYISRLDSGDKEALSRYQRAMKLKMVMGKGYFFFVDKVNRLKPEWYKDYPILASNLCTEIALPSSPGETFTCVLSSLNLAKYDEWKDTDTIQIATIFLHCVALDFINIGKTIKGLENAVTFTQNHMALGLGALGFATYLQDHMIPFESYEAHAKNIEIFSLINEESKIASKRLTEIFEQCKVMEGTEYANATRMAIAPNLSSALICGGVSQG